MNRVQLFYKDIADIVGSDGFCIVRLVEKTEQQSLCIICDKMVSGQFSIRLKHAPGTEQFLPEVLVGMLNMTNNNDFEIMVYDIVDGKYKATLLNKRTCMLKSIRISDAVLLHYIAHIPFYIEEELMQRQSTPYVPETEGISIPINTLDNEHLNRELEKAIEAENYRLASTLHEELQRRNKQ
jgi:hypothetical protein